MPARKRITSALPPSLPGPPEGTLLPPATPAPEPETARGAAIIGRNVYLPIQMYERLCALSKERRMSFSALVRYVLEQAMAQHDHTEGRSA